MTVHQLSWGLVVVTYQREKILSACLQLAVGQTRRPTEIIVIDASENWEATCARIKEEIASHLSDIRWVYQAAEQRSITTQRNQGLQLATTDVVFLIDDDSLMYPDCAEEIMRVYEADTEGRIQGVAAQAVETVPEGVTLDDDRKQVAYMGSSGAEVKKSRFGNFMNGLKDWFRSNILLMNAHKLFISYDATFPVYQLPPSISDLQAVSVELFQGYRMTYRRQAILKEPFEPLLRYYCAGEDLDASYRVSRHGCLVIALNGKLHHFNSGSGRLSRYQVTALSATNQAFLLRRNAYNLKKCKQKYYVLMLRRLLAEFLKDSLSRRWSLPQFRGILAALRHSGKLFALPEQELLEWYPRFQREMLS